MHDGVAEIVARSVFFSVITLFTTGIAPAADTNHYLIHPPSRLPPCYNPVLLRDPPHEQHHYFIHTIPVVNKGFLW